MDQEQDIIRIVKTYLKEKKYVEAERCLNALLLDHTKSFEGYFLLGSLNHQRGKFEQAVHFYKKALTIKSNYTDALLSLSILYNDLGQYEEGQKMFDKVRRPSVFEKEDSHSHLHEQLSQKHCELGAMYEAYHRYDEALREYEKAKELMLGDLSILVRMARMYEKQGALFKSIKLLKELKESKPDYVPGLIRLGLAYYAQGQMIEAIKHWEDVLNLEPKNPEAMMYLRMAEQAKVTSI